MPVSGGFGRYYLIQSFGKQLTGLGSTKDSPDQGPFLSTVWSLQLPSSGFSLASVKDAIRDRLPGRESGAFSWAEVQIEPVEQMTHEGKAHPGPRAFLGADGCMEGSGVVFWGGVDAKGQLLSEGWLLRLR